MAEKKTAKKMSAQERRRRAESNSKFADKYYGDGIRKKPKAK